MVQRSGWLIGVGAGAVAIGVGVVRRLEFGHYSAAAPMQASVARLALVLVLCGLVLIMMGVAMWALRAPARALVVLGTGLTVVSWAPPVAALLNVHGWTGLLMLPLLCGRVIGPLCVVLGAGRAFFARRSPTSSA